MSWVNTSGLLGAFITLWNTYSLKSQANEAIGQKPELAEGYRRFVFGYLGFYSAPRIVTRAGILSGRVESVFNYFKPCNGNPFVTAFYAVLVVPFSALVAWVRFGEGAEFLLEVSEGEGSSSRRVKLTYTAGLIFVLVWIATACKF